MGFDGTKILAGFVLYGLVVGLPTVHLLMEEQQLDWPIVERIVVGIIGVIAGRLVFQGLQGPRDPTDARRQTYWGFNPFLFVGALGLLYLAWVSNAPSWIAGNIDTGVLVARHDRTIPLDRAWERVIMSGLTLVGVWALIKAFKTARTPEERRAERMQKRDFKRMQKQQLAAQQLEHTYE